LGAPWTMPSSRRCGSECSRRRPTGARAVLLLRRRRGAVDATGDRMARCATVSPLLALGAARAAWPAELPPHTPHPTPSRVSHDAARCARKHTARRAAHSRRPYRTSLTPHCIPNAWKRLMWSGEELFLISRILLVLHSKPDASVVCLWSRHFPSPPPPPPLPALPRSAPARRHRPTAHPSSSRSDRCARRPPRRL
jgi:hypothetical protein